MRNPYDEFISRLYTVVEFSMSELEYRSIETSQAKMQRGKRKWKKDQNTQELQGNHKACNICVSVHNWNRGRRRETAKNKYLK